MFNIPPNLRRHPVRRNFNTGLSNIGFGRRSLLERRKWQTASIAAIVGNPPTGTFDAVATDCTVSDFPWSRCCARIPLFRNDTHLWARRCFEGTPCLMNIRTPHSLLILSLLSLCFTSVQTKQRSDPSGLKSNSRSLTKFYLSYTISKR